MHTPSLVDSWVTDIVSSMGYAGVALLMALENIFPPIPSEIVMPLAGYTAANGELNVWIAIAVGTVGTIIGTLPWYYAARWIGEERLCSWVGEHGHWLTVEPKDINRASSWFGRRGRLVVLFGRLVPAIRTFVSVPAGFCKMPLAQYLLYSAIGTTVWTGALTWLGYALGRKYTEVATYLGPVTWGILGVMAIFYVYRLIKLRRARNRRRQDEGDSQ